MFLLISWHLRVSLIFIKLLPDRVCKRKNNIIKLFVVSVIVQAFPETPAVDIESVLFVENGAKALGKVFDVFGPVSIHT